MSKIKIGKLCNHLLKIYTYICNRHRIHWHIPHQRYHSMQHTLLLSSILRSYRQYHQFLGRCHSERKNKGQKIAEENCFQTLAHLIHKSGSFGFICRILGLIQTSIHVLVQPDPTWPNFGPRPNLTKNLVNPVVYWWLLFILSFEYFALTN